eukprot:SAG22_NODE_3039_length_2003_cov_2349.414916_2_plen_57_part_01
MPGLLDYAVLAAPYTSVVYLLILLDLVTSALAVDSVPDPSTCIFFFVNKADILLWSR